MEFVIDLYWKRIVYKMLFFFLQVSNNFDFVGNSEGLFLQYYFEGIVLASFSQSWINMSNFTTNQ